MMSDTDEGMITDSRAWKFEGLRAGGFALLSVTVGLAAAASLEYVNHARADSDHVFELMIYHTPPGKTSELEANFRDVDKAEKSLRNPRWPYRA